MSRLTAFIVLSIFLTTILAACAPTPISANAAIPANTATPATPTAVPLPTFTPIPSPIPGGLHVDAELDLGAISPYIYGTNYGPWIAVPATMLEDAKNSGMSIVRFPGGAWGDRNELKGYQIEQFIAFCKMMGAIPTISVRLRDGSPEQAAGLVKFVNLDQKYGVKYWSIGNEPDLYAQEINAAYDTPQYNQTWRAFAEAMKAVDPSIVLIGPEVSQFTVDPTQNKKDSANRDWMTEFLKANGDLVDIVSIHRYPFPNPPNSSSSIADLHKDAGQWAEIIRSLRSLIRETTGRDIPVAVTEFSTHWNKAVGGDATPDSHYAAIWLGNVLGQFIAEDVQIANHWMLTSSGDMGAWGLVGRGELRPSYYTYQMYKMFGTQRVFSSSDDPEISLYAAKNKDGALTVMLINLSNRIKTLPLKVNGIQAPFTAQVWLFDKDHKAEQQPDQSMTKSCAVTLPGQSMMLLVIK